MTDTDPFLKAEYRGWKIWLGTVFVYEATGPGYDAEYTGPEDGWVDNGEKVSGDSLEAVKAEIDIWFEENDNG